MRSGRIKGRRYEGDCKKWLKQSLHDIEMARKNIEIKGYDVAAFLAHQSKVFDYLKDKYKHLLEEEK